MTVLETFRMLIDGELVESESVTPYGPATVCAKDFRRARGVAAATGAGSV
ncbi:MAG: hypothetical protein JWR85_3785 [Marmoricola sp.]|jgi:hypothetical protein|nr:hypothetical protein [Marmoricola sp.]